MNPKWVYPDPTNTDEPVIVSRCCPTCDAIAARLAEVERQLTDTAVIAQERYTRLAAAESLLRRVIDEGGREGWPIIVEFLRPADSASGDA
jgi:hypothetical protein